MGIPSYFSYIVKNHRKIIQKINDLKYPIHNLYIDSNSIVYDSLRLLKDVKNKDFEKKLIETVCDKLHQYILHIKPNNCVFIAFDGVAPVAKLEQQRNRRYKSTMEKKIMKSIDKNNVDSWNSTAITPGTPFMKKLNKGVNDFFKNKETIYGLNKIKFSGSNKEGEGEHKLFKYIRDNEKSHKHQTTIIYGLDADLIMLSLNHLPIAKHIYLYRETPEFIKSIDRDLNPNESYLLNIPALSQYIISTMNNGRHINNKQQTNRLYDYIFMCFMLGNDFLPHFPSINIRTKGIFKLTSAYKNVLGNTNKNLTNGKIIYWDNFYKLVEYLAKEEHSNIKGEYSIRDKMSKRDFPSNTTEDKKARYLNTPLLNRCQERYIDPYNYGWEGRYYDALFDSFNSKSYIRDLCQNYMEGLEWVMKYYTTGCPDWRWKYNYNYPPLLVDLLRYIPRWNMDLIKINDNKPVKDMVQLAYVLPNESLNLLPQKYHIRLLKKMRECYPTNANLEWAFCKYIWESHVNLPHIDIDKLEQIILQ